MGKTSNQSFGQEYIWMRRGTRRDTEHQCVIGAHKVKAVLLHTDWPDSKESIWNTCGSRGSENWRECSQLVQMPQETIQPCDKMYRGMSTRGSCKPTPWGKKKAKLAAAIKIPTMRSLWKLSSGCTLNERPIQRNIIQLSKDDKNQWIHAGCPPPLSW